MASAGYDGSAATKARFWSTFVGSFRRPRPPCADPFASFTPWTANGAG